MKRFFVAVVALTALVRAEAVLPPPGVYVQDGLVAHWDGIDNQATGVHDPDATSTWIDLTHAYEMNLTDALVLPNGYEFPYREINKVQWQGRGVVSGECYQAFVDVPDKKRTLEMVVQFPDGSGSPLKQGVSRVAANLRNALLGLGYLKDKEDPAWRVAAGPYWAGDNCPMELTSEMTNTFSVLQWLEKDNKAYYQIFSNGVDAVSATDKDRGIGEWRKDFFVFGAQREDGTFGMNGSILAIRLYDRNLTPSEIAYNAAIDNARFLGGSLPPGLIVGAAPRNAGAPTPAYGHDADFVPGTEVTFSIETDEDGWVVEGGRRARFVSVTIVDGDTTETVTETSFSRRLNSASPMIIWNFSDFQYRVEVASMDSAGGRISANGSDAAVSKVVWVNEGSTVTLSASTTDSRYSFSNWGGNVDGIDDLSSSSVELLVKSPRVIQAFFKTTVNPGETYPDGYSFITGGWRPDSEIMPPLQPGEGGGLDARRKVLVASEPIDFSTSPIGLLLFLR